MKRMLVVFFYLATIPLANWLIQHVGTECAPGGPCFIPVFPGILAPSGVLVVGVALVLRDFVQEHFGTRITLACIAAGTLLSATLAPPFLVLASAVAFGVSELADLAVYSPLRRRGLLTAVLLSSFVGAIVDSAAFLGIAFGSLEHLRGQVIGKGWAVLIATGALALPKARRRP